MLFETFNGIQEGIGNWLNGELVPDKGVLGSQLRFEDLRCDKQVEYNSMNNVRNQRRRLAVRRSVLLGVFNFFNLINDIIVNALVFCDK